MTISTKLKEQLLRHLDEGTEVTEPFFKDAGGNLRMRFDRVDLKRSEVDPNTLSVMFLYKGKEVRYCDRAFPIRPGDVLDLHGFDASMSVVIEPA